MEGKALLFKIFADIDVLISKLEPKTLKIQTVKTLHHLELILKISRLQNHLKLSVVRELNIQ
jgi:malic enzyme